MKRRRSMIAYVAVGVCVVLVVAIGLRVDDWKRDWTTNVAQLEHDAADPLLQIFSLPGTVTEIADRCEQRLESQRGWSLSSREGDAERIILHFTRTTSVMRFVDDVELTLTRSDQTVIPPRTLVEAVSRSRIGKGDLGQNPRNLRELVRLVRDLE